MSDDGSRNRRPAKRTKRSSFLGTVMGMVGLGGEGEDEEMGPHDGSPAGPASPTVITGAGSDERPGAAGGTSAEAGLHTSRATATSGDGSAAAALSPSPVRSRGSQQTLQEAASSALRALRESPANPPPAASAAGAASEAKSNQKGKGRATSTSDVFEDAEDGEDEGLAPDAKGKGARGGRAVKMENAHSSGVSADVDGWTREEALARLSYAQQPLMRMRVADLKDALINLGLSHAGNQPALRMRLAQRLCVDLATDTPGLARMEGFESASSPVSGPQAAEMSSSARDARRQKRMTVKIFKTFTGKATGTGTVTKDSPIVISCSDEEAGASPTDPKHTTAPASAAVPACAAASASVTVKKAPSPSPSQPQEEEGQGQGKDAGAVVHGGRHGRSGGGLAAADAPEASVDGVPVMDMKMATLKLHVKRMGLKPTGHLKADLLQCLRDALLHGHSGGGVHGPKRTMRGKGEDHRGRMAAKTKRGGGSGTGGGEGGEDAEPEPDEAFQRGLRARALRGDPPSAPSASPVRLSKTQHARDHVDKPLVPKFAPARVRFRNTPVSAMTPEVMRETLHELDVPSLRKNGNDELTHDVVNALVQRRAEAMDPNSRKQAWRGRPVYMMRKAELADMLRHFNLDDTGNVEALRTRFRRALRKWAADEIGIPSVTSVEDGEGDGDLVVQRLKPSVSRPRRSPMSPTTAAQGGVRSASTSSPRRGRETRRRGMVWDGGEQSTDNSNSRSRRRRPADEKAMVSSRRTAALSPRTTTTETTGSKGSKDNASVKKEGSTRSGRSKPPLAKAASSRATPRTTRGSAPGSAAGGTRPVGEDSEEDADSKDEDKDEDELASRAVGRRREARGRGRVPRPDSKKSVAATAATASVAVAVAVAVPKKGTGRRKHADGKAKTEAAEESASEGKVQVQVKGPRRGVSQRRRGRAPSSPPSRASAKQAKRKTDGESQPQDGDGPSRSPDASRKSRASEVPGNGDRAGGDGDGDGDDDEGQSRARGGGRVGRGRGRGGGKGSGNAGGAGGGGDGSDGGSSSSSGEGEGESEDDDNDNDNDNDDDNSAKEEEEEEEGVLDEDEDEEEEEEEDEKQKDDEGTDAAAGTQPALGGAGAGGAAATEMQVGGGQLREDGADQVREIDGAAVADAGAGFDLAEGIIIPPVNGEDEAVDGEEDVLQFMNQDAMDAMEGGADEADDRAEQGSAGPAEEGDGGEEDTVEEEEALEEAMEEPIEAGDTEGEVDEGDQDQGQEEGAEVQGAPASEELDGSAGGPGVYGDYQLLQGASAGSGSGSIMGPEGELARLGNLGGSVAGADANASADQESSSSTDVAERQEVDYHDDDDDDDGDGDPNNAEAIAIAIAPQRNYTGQNGKNVDDVDLAGGSREGSLTEEGQDDLPREGSGTVSGVSSQHSQDDDDEADEEEEEEEGGEDADGVAALDDRLSEEGSEEEEGVVDEEDDNGDRGTEEEQGEEDEQEQEQEQEDEEFMSGDDEVGEAGGDTSIGDAVVEIEIVDSSDEDQSQSQNQNQAANAMRTTATMAPDQENGQRDDASVDEDDEMADSCHLLDAAADAPIPTVGEANDRGAGQESLDGTQVLQPSPGATHAGAGASDVVVAGSEGAEAARGALRVEESLYTGNAHGAASGAKAQLPFANADEELGQASSSASCAPAGGSSGGGGIKTKIKLRGGRRARQIDKGLDAMLGERSYEDKRDTINFLAYPTTSTRPVNPRLPALSAEQKERVLRAGRSVESWDDRPILTADQEGQASDLADARTCERKRTHARGVGTDRGWRWASSSEWIGLVPSMKRRAQQPAVRGPLSMQGSTWQGSQGSSFRLYKSGSMAEGDSTERLRLGKRPGFGFDDDELTPMLQRLDEYDREATIAPPLDPSAGAAPPFSPGASTSLVRMAAGTPSRTPKPPRIGGLGVGASRDRRRSMGSALRYRSREFTPRRRPSLAGVGVGEQGRGAGTLGEWLGETRAQAHLGPAGDTHGRRGESDTAILAQASNRFGDAERQGASLSLSNGAPIQARGTPAAGNKRAASSLGLEGMDATPRKRATGLEVEVHTEVHTGTPVTEKGRKFVRRVEAEAKATAEVGSILMSVVSQENKKRDVARQVREEQKESLQMQGHQRAGDAVNASNARDNQVADADERGSREEEQGPGQEHKQHKQQPSRGGPGTASSSSLNTFTFTFTPVPAPSATPLPLTLTQPTATRESLDLGFTSSPAPARLLLLQQQEQNIGVAAKAAVADGRDGGMSVDSGYYGDCDGDFDFIPPSSRHAPVRRIQPSFCFSDPPPVKRAIEYGSYQGAGTLTVAFNDDGDIPGAFEFSTEPRKARKTRKDVAAGRSAVEQMAPLAVAPLAVADSGVPKDRDANASRTPDVPAAPAATPVTNGFDMSMFKKPGEWKCEACFVRNPPGASKCLSCETPKPGASGDSASASASSGGQGMLDGGAAAASTTPRFTFGVQPSGGATGTGTGGAVAASTPAFPFTFGSASTATSAAGGILPGAGASTALSFTFGVQPGTAAAATTTSSSSPNPPPLTFGAQPPAASSAATSTAPFTFGARTNA